MVNSINFKNYKAFKTGALQIKPLTILLGANSSGKSSILQLILLLEQTLNLQEPYDSAIKLNGKYINLGEDENIVRDKDLKKELGLEFKLRQNDTQNFLRPISKKLREQLHYTYLVYSFINKYYKDPKKIEFLELINPIDMGRFPNSPAEINLLFEKFEPLLAEMKKNNIGLEKIENIIENSDLKLVLNIYFRRNIRPILFFNIEEYKDAFALFTILEKKRFQNLIFGYKLKYSTKTKKLEIIENYFSIARKKILSLKMNEKKQLETINSEVLDTRILDKYIDPSYFSYDSLELKLNKDTNLKSYNLILEYVFNYFNLLFEKLYKAFKSDQINYVGPLRAYPQRYYFLDEANVNSSLNSSSGNNLAEILKKNKTIHSKVNEWLKRFNLGVSVKEFKDIIHNIKIRQNGLNLDITDVGFGISQILPILVQGFMSQTNSMTIIEQPEIHLHPKMQANLADLFIDIIYSKNNKSNKEYSGRSLLIETHSEYILRRIRRRISEGKLDSKDIAIYFIDPRENSNDSAKIREIEIPKNGSFEWPKDYYETELEDNIQFLKNITKR